jgi:hypothetical protein
MAILVNDAKGKSKLHTFGYNIDMASDREVITGQLGNATLFFIVLY